MNDRTEGIVRQAQELIEQAYNRGYTAGYSKAENDYYAKTEDDRQSSYELGLNMAWDAAKKIAGDCLCESRMTKELFDFNYAYPVFKNISASEAIDKIRAYEEKKQEEDEIKVGDVIQNHDDVEAVVTWCDGKNWNGFLLGGEGVGEVGQVYSCMRYKGWKKTARHFPEIVELLKKMQEGE